MSGHIHEFRIVNTIELVSRATELLSTIAALFASNGLTATETLRLMPALKEFESARRGLAAMDLKVTAAAVNGEMARILGTTRPDDFLASEFRLTRAEARCRIESAAFLGEHPDLAEETASVFARGDITFGALSRARTELTDLHDDCPRSATDIAAEILGRSAACGPHGAASLARKLVREANRPFPRDPAAANKKRRLTVGKQDRDGGTNVTAYLDAATTALLESWLLTHGLKKGSHDDGRTPAQRNADALELALRTAHEAKPRVPGKPMCTVVVAIGAEETRVATGGPDGRANMRRFAEKPTAEQPAAEQPTPHGTTETHLSASSEGSAIHPTRLTTRSGAGIELGLADLLRLGIGEDAYVAVVDPEAPITEAKLRLGRTKRSATLEQHIALQLLDGTCQHPGCNRPPDACDRHHIVSWLRGGRTDVENLTLLCRRHHSDNDDSLGNPARGHMTPRERHPHGRTGWAEPERPDGTRRIRYNSSFRAQEAPGWRAA